MKARKRHFIIGLVVIAVGVALITAIGFKSKDYFTPYNYAEEDHFAGSGLVHFSKMPITYSLDINTAYGLSAGGLNTDDYEEKRIKWALELIQNATQQKIRFEEVELGQKADLNIKGVPALDCVHGNETRPRMEGFAMPEINNETNTIENSTVVYCAWAFALTDYSDTDVGIFDMDPSRVGYSWSKYACEDFPVIELHGIMHGLGFDTEYENGKDLMHPIDFRFERCQGDKLSKNYISCLNNIYSNGQEGSCEEVNFWPWQPDLIKNTSNFSWDSLPIEYHITDCNANQIKNLERAEIILETRLGSNLFNYSDSTFVPVTFKCMNHSNEDINLNWEADLWSNGDLPAAQPYYKFDEEGKIKKVDIILFAQDRKCGGIELHELLHAAGVRGHEGQWMKSEKSVCTNDGVIDAQSLDAVRKIYNL